MKSESKKEGGGKTVMVFGTFDVIHPGHLHFFQQAAKYGDKLIVVVARDVNVFRHKNKNPYNDEKKRLKNIEKIDYINKAILGDKEQKIKPIITYKPSTICLGYDQRPDTKLLNEIENLGIAINRLRPYKSHLYKSSKIINGKQI